MAAAFGFTLIFTGLVTHAWVSLLGAACLIGGLVGWFYEVLPHEAHETVLVEVEEIAIIPGREVMRLRAGKLPHRARLPLEIYPYRAGVRGGLIGGVAMAVLALLYGFVGHRSIWYPINLLAAAGSARVAALSYNQLLAFDLGGLLWALLVHGVGSALVGLLYGVLLPLFPRRPILLGGVIAPLLWSGLLYAGLAVTNPTLEARIDWKWFVPSQIAFGFVAGWVVQRGERIATMQHIPFLVRAGIEAPGLTGGEEGEEPEE
jgi:hypothetical protein